MEGWKMKNKEIEAIIENDDNLYYWARSWTRSNKSNINKFIKSNKSEILNYIDNKEVNKSMNYFYAEFNGKRYDTNPTTFSNLKSLISSVFPTDSFSWTIQFLDKPRFFVSSKNKKIEIFMFQPGTDVDNFTESQHFISEIKKLKGNC
jgi:hypothetical protein